MSDNLDRSPTLLSRHESVLLLVDAQTKLLSVVEGADELLRKLTKLLEAASVLEVPRLATEQYAEKLGPTAEQLQPYIASPPSKLTFSCVGCPDLLEQLDKLDPRQVVVAGLETHVCVAQTCLDLVSRGYEVFVVVDAVTTRHRIDHQVALERLAAHGVTLTTTEAVLFEWCERAGTDQFRSVSQIVKRD